MAGGIGTRLWPVSTPETPKQFIDLLGVGKSAYCGKILAGVRFVQNMGGDF